MPNVDDILKKYSRKIESQIDTSQSQQRYSSSYIQFKQEMIPKLTRYERWAQTLGNLIKIKVREKDKVKIHSYLQTAHLEVTAEQSLTLAIISLLGIFLATLLITVAIFLITGTVQILLGFLGLLISLFVFYYTYSMPQRLAKTWRLKASSQMVPAILYMVVYMKHTPNLERAIQFASEHLEGPLALDFKKVFYDVEIGKYSTIKQSMNYYLESAWRQDAPEFLESFHMIESSLFEPQEVRRILILEKALQVILDGVYEKMLQYSREIRSPLTNIYMLGIILPTLGLALLPLASTLLGGIIKWHHVFVIFNILIPFFVFYLTSEILLKRPGGYGETSVLELNPDYSKYKSKKPWILAGAVALPLLILGLSPFIFNYFQQDFTLGEIGLPFFKDILAFDFKTNSGVTSGPFGLVATLLSLFIPISIALFFSISFSNKTSQLIKSRNQTKALETEFTNSLFQLGNRLGEGIPAEISFSKVANSTSGLKTQQFFQIVNQNMNQLGMPLEQAIFNKKRGAIIYFPSSLISTSMRILLESIKKGLKVAARSLMSISQYVKNIQKINQRLQDLLAEVISDMKSNMTFLAPLLAGIIVGLASMITLILNKLQLLSNVGSANQEIAGLGTIGNITSIFDVTQMIPPYFIQATIGIYIIQIIFILTSALVTVNSGKDTLQERNQLAKNLIRGIILYTITALISIIALSSLAIIALGGISG